MQASKAHSFTLTLFPMLRPKSAGPPGYSLDCSPDEDIAAFKSPRLVRDWGWLAMSDNILCNMLLQSSVLQSTLLTAQAGINNLAKFCLIVKIPRVSSIHTYTSETCRNHQKDQNSYEMNDKTLLFNICSLSKFVTLNA
jgi:hypothetical protein